MGALRALFGPGAVWVGEHERCCYGVPSGLKRFSNGFFKVESHAFGPGHCKRFLTECCAHVGNSRVEGPLAPSPTAAYTGYHA